MEISSYLPEKKIRKPMTAQLVLPGEVVTDDPTAMRGHGTYLQDGKIISSVCGTVDKVGKLVSVKPLKSRYSGETGDVVVGRVVEVANNRWKIDVNAKQHAILLIGAVNLHGGIHRRRTLDDALQMRNYFVENDMVVADVQSTFHDGSISLQVPRTLGKLDNGVFIAVDSSLIKRVKSHFCSLPCDVDVILGNNGYIWITPSLSEEEQEQKLAQGSDWKAKPIPKDLRQNMARVRNCISILANLFLPIHPDTIMHVYKASLNNPVKDMLKPEVILAVSQGVSSAMASSS